MRLVIISDTHEQEDKIVLPEGDVLIHCGDITYKGSISAITKFSEWLDRQKFAKKCIILGNHDLFEFRNQHIPAQVLNKPGVHFLHNSGVEIDGVKFWGSPYSPRFFDWAWNVDRGSDIAKIWAQIPDDTNVLITHGPQLKVLDEVPRGENVGCRDLSNRINELKVLKVFCFGHIHNSSGVVKNNRVWCVNASICDEQYRPTNPPRVIDI